MAQHYDEKVTALRVYATLGDFDGDVEKWKLMFYELWRYQMTWDFAYRIRVVDNRDDVFVEMLIVENYKEPLLKTMDSLGYRNVIVEEETVGEVWLFEHDDLEDIDYLHLKY